MMYIMYGKVNPLQDMQQLPFIGDFMTEMPTPFKKERLKVKSFTNEQALVLNHNGPMKQE